MFVTKYDFSKGKGLKIGYDFNGITFKEFSIFKNINNRENIDIIYLIIISAKIICDLWQKEQVTQPPHTLPKVNFDHIQGF